MARYPTLDAQASDEVTYERHLLTLKKELEKPKPKQDVVLELMQVTFPHRRRYILDEAASVRDILHKFPALKMPDVVSEG